MSSEDLSLTPSVRRFIIASRDNECELCGASGLADDVDLEIHHRKERQEGGKDNPNNLILLCRECHQRHHNNQPVQRLTERSEEKSLKKEGERTESEVDLDEPLPPKSEPNGADKEILAILEDQGALTTGELAVQMDYTKQYVRRQCWKLSGEQLVVPCEDNTWDLAERADKSKVKIGLPDDPEGARRAGRDEVIRRMSADGMAHTQIAEITGLSRSTIDIAVNRARALRIDDSEDAEVDLATIATRLSALLDLIDHSHMETDS